jgi:hypothetical protein
MLFPVFLILSSFQLPTTYRDAPGHGSASRGAIAQEPVTPKITVILMFVFFRRMVVYGVVIRCLPRTEYYLGNPTDLK